MEYKVTSPVQYYISIRLVRDTNIPDKQSNRVIIFLVILPSVLACSAYWPATLGCLATPLDLNIPLE